MANEQITREEFEIEMLRRERRIIPAIKDFVRYFVRDKAPSEAHRDAAFEGFLWTFLSPGGTVATLGVGLVALSTAAFSGWAAWETKRSADTAVKATQASVWLQLLAEYSDVKMLEAMNAIRGYQVHHKHTTEDSFIRDLVLTDNHDLPMKETVVVDGHRRIVGNYFHKVATLVEAGIVDEAVIRGAWGSGLLPFIEDVLFPLEIAKAKALFTQGKMSEEALQDGLMLVERRRLLWRRLLSVPGARLTPPSSGPPPAAAEVKR